MDATGRTRCLITTVNSTSAIDRQMTSILYTAPGQRAQPARSGGVFVQSRHNARFPPSDGYRSSICSECVYSVYTGMSVGERENAMIEMNET
ncbi:hypothetical protein ElyMa_000417600 [Elysia marginata]|uniref:Uncharacterized protein n=1 Tax=Elysia marginata TaxID=1093978 RepID=A0AAV4FKL4_9GAST|nr:hypothetical protein ElyMa_000417600 [Elysia marginata]